MPPVFPEMLMPFFSEIPKNIKKIPHSRRINTCQLQCILGQAELLKIATSHDYLSEIY